jgi:hypothetical protein
MPKPLTMRTNRENNLAAIRSLADAHVALLQGRPLVLLDADHTLAPIDASKTFFKEAGWSTDVMIKNFDRYGYEPRSFEIHRRIHWPEAPQFGRRCVAAANAIQLSPAMIAFLKEATGKAYVVVLTGGLSPVWRRVLEQAGFPGIPVHGSVEAEHSPVFSSEGKGAFAQALAKHAKWSVAIGDSEIETDMMLNCQHAVVVARRCKKTNELNPRLLESVRRHPLLWSTSHDHQRHQDLPFSPWDELFPHLETIHRNRHAA